jgi:hypothetical protein
MRHDMAKVIVERPRHGSSLRGESKGYQRSLQRLGREELPYREGMKKRPGFPGWPSVEQGILGDL